MGSHPAVVDISSDEESDWDIDTPVDWLSELLDDVGEENEESDDVVVVDELSCASVQKQSYTPSNSVKDTLGHGSDDECLVLDGDPDKPATVEDDKGDGFDDILVVGEKGEIACRDFPHPRHMCAKFPFRSTPHEKYCDLCHCYVCDIRAPCASWSNGGSNKDHCHATDKDEMWKNLRRCFKLGNKAAVPEKKSPDTTLTITPQWHISDPNVLLPQDRNLGPVVFQPMVSNSTYTQACSTSFGVPNILNHRRTQHPMPMHGRHRLAPYPNRSQPLVAGTCSIGRARGVGSTFSPHFVHSHLKARRIESTRGNFIIGNQSRFAPPSNSNQTYTATPARSQTAPVMGEDDIHNRRLQDFLASIDLELGTFEDPSLPNATSFGDFPPTHTSSTQPQAHGQQNTNPSSCQFVNPAVGGANQNPLDFDYSWPPQPSLMADSTIPSIQPAETPVVSQAAEPALGSAEFHLENWMYSLDHRPGLEVAMDPLNFGPSHATGADPSLLIYEYEEYMGHLGRVA